MSVLLGMRLGIASKKLRALPLKRITLQSIAMALLVLGSLSLPGCHCVQVSARVGLTGFEATSEETSLSTTGRSTPSRAITTD